MHLASQRCQDRSIDRRKDNAVLQVALPDSRTDIATYVYSVYFWRLVHAWYAANVLTASLRALARRQTSMVVSLRALSR